MTPNGEVVVKVLLLIALDPRTSRGACRSEERRISMMSCWFCRRPPMVVELLD